MGPVMDLIMEAYKPAHEKSSHEVLYHLKNADHIAGVARPDIVFCSPLAMAEDSMEGCCSVSRFVDDGTLVVALFASVDKSNAMFTVHARSGDCHSNMLLHYPRPENTVEDVIGVVDDAARRRSSPKVEASYPLPKALIPPYQRDIGSIMREKPDLQEFLYRAALDSNWSTWGQLANILGMAEGSVKNKKLAFHKELIEAGCVESGKWSVGDFVRYMTEHRTFVRAYAESHLEFGSEAQGLHQVS